MLQAADSQDLRSEEKAGTRVQRDSGRGRGPVAVVGFRGGVGALTRILNLKFVLHAETSSIRLVAYSNAGFKNKISCCLKTKEIIPLIFSLLAWVVSFPCVPSHS